MLGQSMRPKWQAEISCLPTSHGVYLRGNKSYLMLKGKSLYSLLKHLIPYLDGKATLAEITDGLDADRKRMISNLLEKLLTHGFLQDSSQDQLHTLSPMELETYAPDITFLESFQTSAASRFERFHNSQLLIIGSGLSFTSLIQASLRCGVRHVNAMSSSEDEVDSGSHQKILDGLAGSASGQNVQLIDPPCWDHEVEIRKAIQAHDAILHIAERPMLARAQLLNRLCVEQHKTFIQAIVIDDHAWIGPLVGPETSACWECAWRRLQANRTQHLSLYTFQDQPLVAGSPLLAMPEATIIANRLLFACFRSLTQMSSPGTTGRLSVIDLGTGLSESHPFLPHPHCLACQHPVPQTASHFLERIQQLQHNLPFDTEQFLDQFNTCIDQKLGLFPAWDEHFVQVPLATCQVHLSNPLLQPQACSVVAVSTQTAEARRRAAQKACECYAASLVDQRRLLPPDAVPQHPFLSADQLIGTETLPPEGEMWTWAFDLHMQQASLVPATAVFSSLCSGQRGIASGQTWEEAIGEALSDWCNSLTVRHLNDAQQAYPQVDLARTPMTPEGRYLSRLLKTAGEQVAIYDVTGPLQVPTFATCLGEKVVAYSTHCDEAQALRMGLEQALQQSQSKQDHQVDSAVAVPDLPSPLRSDHLSVPRSLLPNTWPARQAWLLQQLQSNGLRAFVVPLDHDPALTQMFPFLVRVLLCRKEMKDGE